MNKSKMGEKMSDVLEKLSYGHYVLTALKSGDELRTQDRDYLAAGTVNWVSQVSFDPQMIMVAVDQNSDLNETIDYSGEYTLHLLSEQQKSWVEKFSSDSKIEGNKINGIPFEKKDGELLLDGALGSIHCEVEKSFNAGDHSLHLGKVVRSQLNRDEEALCTKDSALQYSQEKVDKD